MIYVLSGYSLSKNYREKLERLLVAPIESIQLVELRQAGILGMIKALRRLKGTALYVAYEEASGKAVLPVLRLAAAIVPITRQFLVDHEFRVEAIGRGQAARHALSLLVGSLAGLLRCALAHVRARSVLTQGRISARAQGQRVLYLNANLWFGVKAGGSVGHISGVVNALSQEGYDVLFCSAGGRLLVEDKTPFMQLVPPTPFGVPWEINYYSFDERVVEQVLPAARKFIPSFIYQRMSLGNMSGVRLSRKLGVPLVLEYNGSEVWVARNWGRPLRFESTAALTEEACLRQAHLIVTVSSALRDELLARGIDEARIANYPNCIDPRMFDPARFSTEEIQRVRKKYDIESDALVVAFIGSFGQWHGAPVLAEAIRRMIDNEADWLDERRVRFLLIGDGIMMPEVRSVLGGRLNSRYVRLTGLVPQETAPLHLAAADVLSSPHIRNRDGSAFFGSPTKLFEYMAMGKAIIASDLDQIGSVLRPALSKHSVDGEHVVDASALALLCTPGSVDELANGIRFLVNNPVARQILGKNARLEALRRYTWSHHVKHILNALHGLQTGIVDRAAE